MVSKWLVSGNYFGLHLHWCSWKSAHVTTDDGILLNILKMFWTRPEHACPLPSPCICSWKDVSVQIQNKNSWFWTPKVTTVYRHRVNCSNRCLTTKNLPKMNVTGSSEDFALFDFSQNKLRAFPNFYFEKVPGKYSFSI